MESFECGICMDSTQPSQTVIFKCLHFVCEKCFLKLFEIGMPRCPTCRAELSNQTILMLPKIHANPSKEGKLDVLVESLLEMKAGEKAIVFTQFDKLLRHVKAVFEAVGVNYVVLRGRPSDINMSLSGFRENGEVRVLLMSVEQAASGINVSEANRVYFLHPLFGGHEIDASVYRQCVGRAHRIGQKRDVDVTLLYTENSEEAESHRLSVFQNLKFN